jgi:hypothetical protein
VAKYQNLRTPSDLRQDETQSTWQPLGSLNSTYLGYVIFPMDSTALLGAVLHRIHSLLTLILLRVLSVGPIPRHVGFVMDGNRRYARGRGMQVAQGHTDGFSSLRRVRPVENDLLSLFIRL